MLFRKRTSAKKIITKVRAGFSLVELLIAVVVLGILSSMLIAAGTASQSKARMSVAQNDLDSLKNSIYQGMMAHPNIMKMKDSEETFKTVIDYMNSELDDAWQLERIGTPVNSGLVAYSRIHRNPWGNPYGVYVFTNDTHTAYLNEKGEALGAADSCMYIVVASAGRNGTGGPLGVGGANLTTEGTLETSVKGVCNTDGIDDLGVILRIKNGTLMTASFGTDQSTLGALKDVQWIFGRPVGSGGHLYDFTGAGTEHNQPANAVAGSIDFVYDATMVEKMYATNTSGGTEPGATHNGVGGAWGTT